MGLNGCAAVPQRETLQVGGRRVGLVDWGGHGPPVMLLHGITSAAYTWWQVAPALVAAGHRVYAIDMPGHGISDLPPAHQIEAIAGVAGGVVAALGLQGLTLIGHSWGGATALALAAGDDPARGALSRLVLVDPLLAMTAGRGREVLPRYTAWVGEPADAVAGPVAAANPGWHPCDVYWKSQAYAECRMAAVEGLFVHSGDWSLTGRPARVGVPMLTLLADPAQTIIAPALLAEFRAAGDPARASLVEVPGATHNMFRGPAFSPSLAALLAWLAAAA